MPRFTITDLVRESGLCAATLRKYSDSGKIPVSRDANNWRVFTEESIEMAKEIAGVAKQKPATGDTARVG